MDAYYEGKYASICNLRVYCGRLLERQGVAASLGPLSVGLGPLSGGWMRQVALDWYPVQHRIAHPSEREAPMRLNRTPIDVLFDVLDAEFGLDKRTVSRVVLADREVAWGQGTKNGRAMAKNLSNRRLLTDNVSNALPGSIPRDALDDLDVSVPGLIKCIARQMSEDGDDRSARERYAHVCEVLLRECPDGMIDALEDYACPADIFDNVLDAVRDSVFAGPMEQARAALALWVTTGFLGDPYQAARLTVRYCGKALGVLLLQERDPAEAEGMEHASGSMGIQRVFRGGVRGRRHTLDPEGTVIGMLPEPEGSFVADVNNSVSAEHLRIWREDDGAWYAEGLGSLFGTTLERPGQNAIVVEPPAGEDGPTNPVMILPGDVLVLGSTRFEVQLFHRGE